MVKIEPDRVQPSYNSFLIGKLQQIWDAWDRGDPEFALDRTCRFTVFLTPEIKEVIKDDLFKVNEARRKAYNLQGSDFFLTQVKRNRKGREVAIILLPRFLDEIVNLLDKWGLLREVKRKVPKGGE